MGMIRNALDLWKQTRERGEKGTSMYLRLVAFFAFFVLALAMAFLLIMIASGVFNSGVKESRIWMETELDHVTSDIYTEFGRLSLQGVALSEDLSDRAEDFLAGAGLSAAELAEYPEVLDALLATQIDGLLPALVHNKCSGAFVVLDASVSAADGEAPATRAGIFLKRTEPNAVSMLNSKYYYLRGPAAIARDHGIELLGQWRMEFDDETAAFFDPTVAAARENPLLPLSRLYYWSHRITLSGNSESGMLLCLPLRAADGTVFGVCGLEVSSMLFKLLYSPDNSDYPRIFSTLAPFAEESFNMDAGLLAGNSYLTNPMAGQVNSIRNTNTVFSSYDAGDGSVYGGLHQTISLYPTGSPHGEEHWVVGVLMPDQDLSGALRGNNWLLYLSLSAVLLLSLVAVLLISKRYITPVTEALDQIRHESYDLNQKSKYLEINDLLEFLAAQDETREALAAELEAARQAGRQPARGATSTALAEGPDLSAYEQFVQNIATLSTAEKAVFDLYMEGHTAREISELLFLSMNTIKTHNRRIYTKLNVTSRKELMVYVQMMTGEIPEREDW